MIVEETKNPEIKLEEESDDVMPVKPLSQSKAEQLKQEALEAFKLFQEHSKSFYEEESDIYYLLSKKWLNRWKKFVSYEDFIHNRQPSPYFGGPIPGVINAELLETEVEPCFKYSPLKEHIWNVWTKPSLNEGVDYEIVSKNIWNFFSSRYENKPIMRGVEGEGTNKIVRVNLLRFQALLLYPGIVSGVGGGYQNKNYFDKEYLQISPSTQLKEFYNMLQKTVPTFRGNFARDNGVRVWKYSQQDPHKSLYAVIKKQTMDLEYNEDAVFDFDGDLIDPSKYDKMEEIGINDTDLIIVEKQFKDQYKPWCIKNPAVPVEGKCEGCYHIKVLSFPCICRKVSYCSEQCKITDEKYHLNKCEKQGSDDETIKSMSKTESSLNGIVGLANLGNTCFMNSGLQCMSNTWALTEYFLTNQYFDEINYDNPLGTQGVLVKKFGSLVKRLWHGNKNVVNPLALKAAVGKFQPMFKGYHQHDSSELVTFLLDGMHEDLNRIKKKPYVESKDSAGRSDFEVAKESWEGYNMRNRSIIVDLMYGQYKSTLKCPTCEMISITFDPYLMVSLGVPNMKKKVLNYKIYQNITKFDNTSEQFEKGSNQTIGVFKEEKAKKLGVVKDHLIVYIPSTYSSYEILKDGEAMVEVRKKGKRAGLCIRILNAWEGAVPLEERVYVPFQNKASEGHGYKRSLYQNGIFCASTNFTLVDLHLQTFKMLSFLFTEVLTSDVDLNSKEDLKVAYESNVMKQVNRILDSIFKFYILEFKSNSSFWQQCSFCDKKSCQDCAIAYNDETLQQVLERAKKNDATSQIEISILWLKSPNEKARIFDIFDSYLKTNVMRDENEEKNGNANSLMSTPTAGVTLYDCLMHSQVPEQLEKDNTWYCKKCQDHVQAYKSMSIYKAPKILIFHLKRFKASNRMFKQKLETLVDFPINGLDMSDYVLNTCQPNGYDQETEESNGEKKTKLLYDLYAISNHYGGLGGGHYTAYGKNKYDKKWYHFDDSHVSQVGNEENIITKAAYVLFYQLREQQDNQEFNELN